MPKFYTAFLFNHEPDPEKLHCTHKYLGELNEDAVHTVIGAVDWFFNMTAGLLRFPKAIFSKREYFDGVPVLVPEKFDTEDFFPQLKQKLDWFRADDFDKYRPHVSTDLACVANDMTSYVLVKDGKIINTWKLAPRREPPGDLL